MICQKKTINNVPTLVPLTADTGSGNPIGTILALYKKSAPNGYLYCDGSTFDETAYPGLYAYLGTNVLPDYREFTLVGAEENTTSALIEEHDVFSQGEEKDDQIQNIKYDGDADGSINIWTNGAQSPNASPYKRISLQTTYNVSQGIYGAFEGLGFDASKIVRTGTTTRTKEKAVFFYIKATTGLDENQQDYVLDAINENNSYSTEERATGATWIDGKPIYRRTFSGTTSIANERIEIDVGDINLVSTKGMLENNVATPVMFPIPYFHQENNETYELCLYKESQKIYVDLLSTGQYPYFISGSKWHLVIEYTKV